MRFKDLKAGQKRWAKAQLNKGVAPAVIAKTLGVDSKSIRNLKYRTKQRESNIQTAYEFGQTATELAKRYNVSESTIRKITGSREDLIQRRKERGAREEVERATKERSTHDAVKRTPDFQSVKGFTPPSGINTKAVYDASELYGSVSRMSVAELKEINERLKKQFNVYYDELVEGTSEMLIKPMSLTGVKKNREKYKDKYGGGDIYTNDYDNVYALRKQFYTLYSFLYSYTTSTPEAAIESYKYENYRLRAAGINDKESITEVYSMLHEIINSNEFDREYILMGNGDKVRIQGSDEILETIIYMYRNYSKEEIINAIQQTWSRLREKRLASEIKAKQLKREAERELKRQYKTKERLERAKREAQEELKEFDTAVDAIPFM